MKPSIQTFSGLMFDYENPNIDMISELDIAVSLSRNGRFLHHTLAPYSIAQHSIHVADMIKIHIYNDDDYTDLEKNQLIFCGFLHDAHEAYIGDIPSPLKKMSGLSDFIKPIELRIQKVIHEKFGLPLELSEEWLNIIHKYDLIALATEKRDLLSECVEPWLLPYEPSNITITPWHFDYTLGKFRKTFKEMRESIGVI